MKHKTMKHKIVSSRVTLVLAAMAWVPSTASAGKAAYIEPPMVSIPAGEFYMGSERGQANERPVHKVSVPAFQMGKYEVTLAEFRRFIEATGYEMSQHCTHRIGERWFGSGESDGSWDRNIYASSEYHPVVCISRTDALNYAKWLSGETGKHYRLPTEAEWEYTVRAGTDSRYFYGDEVDSPKACRYANIADLHAKNQSGKLHSASYDPAFYNIQPCNDHEVTIATVGLYEPNPFGVHDLLGNVVERLADCYQDSYVGAPSDGSALTKKDCQSYVTRGGSWHWEAFTSSTRNGMSGDMLAALEGFRLALDTGGKALPSQAGDSKFMKKLAMAQEQARASHDLSLSYPAKPEGVEMLEATGDRVSLRWQEGGQSVTGYKLYRQDPMTNHTELLAPRLQQAHFVDASPLAHNGRYFVVALNGEYESLRSDSVDSGLAMIHALPVKIEGEAFARAVGTRVKNSGLEAEGDKIISDIGENSASYRIRVSRSGQYKLAARVFDSGVPQAFELWLGDTKLVRRTLGGERGWKTLEDIQLAFPEGTHTLTIKGEQTLFAVNWLDITAP